MKRIAILCVLLSLPLTLAAVTIHYEGSSTIGKESSKSPCKPHIGFNRGRSLN